MHPSVWMVLAAAAGVAVLHSILPDHWVPLAVIGRAERWSLLRTGKVGAWTGVGHVAGSLALGVVLIVIGLGVGSIVKLEGWIVGAILIATGIGFFIWGALRHRDGHGHPHPHTHGPPHGHDHGHLHDHDHAHGHAHEHVHDDAEASRLPKGRTVAWLIPVGIAASPDPTILPVFLAGATLGLVAAVETVVVYAVVTILVITGLTVAATVGGYQVEWPWLEAHAEQVTAGVLVLMGAAAIVAL